MWKPRLLELEPKPIRQLSRDSQRTQMLLKKKLQMQKPRLTRKPVRRRCNSDYRTGVSTGFLQDRCKDADDGRVCRPCSNRTEGMRPPRLAEQSKPRSTSD